MADRHGMGTPRPLPSSPRSMLRSIPSMTWPSSRLAPGVHYLNWLNKCALN